MIGLSLSSISEHNMWLCYDWVVVVVFPLLAQYLVVLWLGCRCCLLTKNNDNPILIPPHVVLTDGRQQRQPNHNTTTYYVYWRTTTTINPIIIRPHCMFTDRRHVVVLWLGCRCFLSVNTICGRIMIGLSLSSVSKHNMWSYYDWVVYDHILCLLTEDNDNPIIIRPHIVFTGRRQRQPNDNTTTYCVDWRTTTTTTQS
jgi:hypothetical protein